MDGVFPSGRFRYHKQIIPLFGKFCPLLLWKNHSFLTFERGSVIKRILSVCILCLATSCLTTKNFEPLSNAVNAIFLGEQSYHTAPVFSSVKNIIITDRQEIEQPLVLNKEEWSYSPETGIIVLEPKINNARYIVNVIGTWETPWTFLSPDPIIPGTVRLHIKEEFGEENTDFFVDYENSLIRFSKEASRVDINEFYLYWEVSPTAPERKGKVRFYSIGLGKIPAGSS